MALPNTNNDESPLTITSIDGETLTVPAAVKQWSQTIADICEDLPDEDEPIPILNEKATSANLVKMVEFITHLHGSPEAARELQEAINDKVLEDKLPEWFLDFIAIPMQQKCDLLILADYLHIKILIDSVSLHMANMIRMQTMTGLERMFS